LAVFCLFKRYKKVLKEKEKKTRMKRDIYLRRPLYCCA
jgi:hypothetical protein